MFNNKKVSLVTRTMGRLSFLRQTLPAYCRVIEFDKIIIVDWGMTEDLVPLMLQINDQRINILQVPNKTCFVEGNTRNLGIRYADPGYILMIDCDIMLYKSPFCLIDVSSTNKFYVKDKERNPYNGHRGLGGTCILEKHMWETVNGYIEELPSWGQDDDDFYRRLEARKMKKVCCLSAKFITHIPHDNDLRIKNMKVKQISVEKNIQVLNSINAQTQAHSKYLCNVVSLSQALMNQLI